MLLIFGDEDELRKVGGVQNKDHALAAESARYVFDTPKGKKNLSELFDGRNQLIVYHFMLGPGWGAGFPGCSFLSDHIDGALPHLEHHDVTLTAVSRAPFAEIEAYKKRMGWRFPWVSAFATDFNYDYHVSFTGGRIGEGQSPLQLHRNACACGIDGHGTAGP